MTEFEPLIERDIEPLELNFRLGKEVVKLVLEVDNTLITRHAEEYEQFDYVMVLHNEEQFMRVWKQDDVWNLLDALEDRGFDVLYRTYPTPDDQKALIEYNTRYLDEL